MIYLDNAATTKPYNELSQLIETAIDSFGNPSSRHSYGLKAKELISTARKDIATIIGASPEEIVFTSGGTEANNLIIRSICQKYGHGHIITTSIEHESILKTCKLLDPNSFQVTYLPVRKNGLISIADFEKAIRPDTILVSIQMTNNEVGVHQDIPKIAAICRKNNIFLHSDCVQAVGHQLLNPKQLGLNSISASAHKFNGLKGSGFLFCDDRSLPIVIGGGGQEFGRRSGTENVLGIIAMAKALAISMNGIEEKARRINAMREYLSKRLLDIEGVTLNVNPKGYSSIVNFRTRGIDNESLLALLDIKGIYCSSGSACLSNGNELSPTLVALGLTRFQILHSIRVSLSADNTIEDCDHFVEAIGEIVSERKKRGR